MSEATEQPPVAAASAPARWRTNLVLFLVTVGSILVTGVAQHMHGTETDEDRWYVKIGILLRDIVQAFGERSSLVAGLQFAGTLVTILVAHELGHYVAARIHKVPASLPYFIPLPIVSPFGTMGAVIRMRGTIPTRRALLDIGASGPLAGLCFAIPLYAWGAAHSTVVPMVHGDGSMMQLGESIALKTLDHFFAPPVPEGMDLNLSPIAFGAWGGMFVTMINLLPVSQLDGGHVAYALFGPRQNGFAQNIHRAMLVFFFVAIAGHVFRDAQEGLGLYRLGQHVGNCLFWLVWFQVLAILGSLSSPAGAAKSDEPRLDLRTRAIMVVILVVLASYARDSHSVLVVGSFFAAVAMMMAMERRAGVLKKHDLLDHPPTAAQPLDPARAAVAILTLAFFALLFMPEPFSM